MGNWIRRWWHWFFEIKAWRARYPDGKLSERMTYCAADDYTMIFGGDVEYDPPPAQQKDGE